MVWLCSALLVLGLSCSAAADVTGKIRVKDGDTFEVAGRTIRLFGIDAPETDQMCGGQGAPLWACGAWAAAEVKAQYAGRTARCEVLDQDRYGRDVARCFVGQVDVGQALVRDGLAFAYRQYSMDYDFDEKSAAISGKGLHATGVQSPSEFRAFVRQTQSARSLDGAPAGCVIKGNISSDGKRIYHMPGQEWYERTRISTSKGERWFCSEAEAAASGWRPARK